MTTARVIPTQVHAVLDYLTGVTLVAAPRLLGLSGTTAGQVLNLAGGIATAQSLLTDYELGLVKVIPMRAHLTLDAASGAMVAASPWLFGFANNGTRYWLPHVLVGATEILAAATTKTRQTVVRKQGSPLLGALGLGAVAGIRSMTPPALLSRAASRGEVRGIGGTPFGFLASPRVATWLTVLAVGEISADKLPFSPDRISPPGLAGRLATGALVGAALYAADGRKGATGGALGALSSLAASYLSFYARNGAQQKLGLPNPAGGILEDTIALGIGLRSLRSAKG